jgi:hypothetical protein
MMSWRSCQEPWGYKLRHVIRAVLAASTFLPNKMCRDSVSRAASDAAPG